MSRILLVISLFFVLSVPSYAADPTAEPKPPSAAQAAAAAVPLDQPNMDHAALLTWAALAACDALKFSHADYEPRLRQASLHFSDAGWESFASWAQKSRIIDLVTAQKMILAAQPKEPPVIIQEGALEGKYRWVLSMPVLTNYRSASNQRTQIEHLYFVVERASVAESADGVAIAQFILEDKLPEAPSSAAEDTSVKGWLQEIKASTPPAPSTDKDAMLAWAAAAAARAQTFGFDNYEESAARSQKDFTPEGWEGYQRGLLNTGALRNVVEHQQILTAAPLTLPFIDGEGLTDGIYQWRLHFVLVQTLRAGNKKTSIFVPVKMTVVRSPAAQNPPGFSISAWAEVE
ncbi:MAG: hypothetical protein EPN97_08585 [Alphaproteobacteria bacterium]|nr:MAG: hypothetical protein EPN97_08585 [Alphaproteobacteria bacterium]